MRPGGVQVTFDCAAPQALATFWAAVLGYPPPADDSDPRWRRIEDPDGVRPTLFFQQVPEAKVAKNRVHLDVRAGGDGPGERRAHIEAEVTRLVSIGARRHEAVTDENGYFVVMADPEGNEFCVD